MRKPPNPTRRCRRCGHPVTYVYYGWKHATGGQSHSRSCGQKPDVVEVQIPYPQRWPRWSLTPQDGKGWVIRQDREEMGKAKTIEDACYKLQRLADAMRSIKDDVAGVRDSMRHARREL